MKKSFFNIIWTINGVFFLLILIAICIITLIERIDEIFRKPEGVQLINEDDRSNEGNYEAQEAKKLLKAYDVYENIIVLKVLSTAIIEPSKMESVVDFSGSYKSEVQSVGGLVNLLFIDKYTGETVTLFSKEKYIIYSKIANSYKKNSVNVDKNIYIVVENDTNSNQRLDREDEIIFYISDFNGNNVERVFGNIKKYYILDNENIFLTFNDESYMIYNFVKDIPLYKYE